MSVLLSPIFLFSVVCQAVPLTERFIVELKQNSVFPNHSFSIKRHLPVFPGHLPRITDTNIYAESDSPPYNKRHRFVSYRVKRSIIKSISWQFLYLSHLLAGYELTVITKELSLCSTPYSWLPVEVMFGSGHTQQPSRLSESSGEQASGATNEHTGMFRSPLHSDSGDGNRGPHQPQHTLDLNCFISPCLGVCSLRPSSRSRESAEWPLNFIESSKNPSHSVSSGAVNATDPDGSTNCDETMQRNLPTPPDDWIIINGLLKLAGHNQAKETGISCTPAHLTNPAGTSSSGCLPSGEATHREKARSNHMRRDRTGPKICSLTLVGQNGQQRPCGKACKNTRALADHRRITHSSEQTCYTTVAREDRRQRQCRKVFKNSKSLSSHKSREHSGQQTCAVTVIGDEGQPQQCGTVCKNAKGLSFHKRREHSVQKTCSVAVVGEDGQQRPCGKVCKNPQSLSSHKSREHSGPQICNIPIVGEDDQPLPCRTVCKNASILSDHKRREHSGQQTCDLNVIGEDGQLRPCGTVRKNIRSLADHKRRAHSEQQTCDLIIDGEDGQLLPCGKVCKNRLALADHKRRYRKHKSCDLTQSGDPSPRKGKLNN